MRMITGPNCRLKSSTAAMLLWAGFLSHAMADERLLLLLFLLLLRLLLFRISCFAFRASALLPY